MTSHSDMSNGKSIELSVLANTDIRNAVRSGNCEALKIHLKAECIKFESVSLADKESGMTILHLACSSEKKRDGEKLVGIILNCGVVQEALKSDEGRKAVEKFVNAQESSEQKSALEIAISNRNRGAVMILIKNLSNVNQTAIGRISPVADIFKNLPKVMLLLLQQSFEIIEDDDDDSDEFWQINCNFTVFTGTPCYLDRGRDKRVADQVGHIANAFLSNKESRSEILEHPLVQLFLHFKWIKIRRLIFFSIIYHITWSVMSLLYILDPCIYPQSYDGTNVSSSEETAVPECTSLFQTLLPTWLILLLAIVMIIKECFEFASSPSWYRYFIQLENWGQWGLAILLILLVSLTLPHWVNAIAVFISCLLILGQLNKIPGFSIYMEMLVKVIKRILKFLGLFLPLLMAFVSTFHLLMPKRPEFASIWPPFSIVKIMAMLTGEINYDDVFHGEESESTVSDPIPTIILFFAFITVVTIGFQNLLIGLTVADIQALQKKAKESSLANKLEQIYLMEMFIFSKYAQSIFKIDVMWRYLKHKWLLVPDDIEQILGKVCIFTYCRTLIFGPKKGSKPTKHKNANPKVDHEDAEARLYSDVDTENFKCTMKLYQLPIDCQLLIKSAVKNNKIIFKRNNISSDNLSK